MHTCGILTAYAYAYACMISYSHVPILVWQLLEHRIVKWMLDEAKGGRSPHHMPLLPCRPASASPERWNNTTPAREQGHPLMSTPFMEAMLKQHGALATTTCSLQRNNAADDIRCPHLAGCRGPRGTVAACRSRPPLGPPPRRPSARCSCPPHSCHPHGLL